MIKLCKWTPAIIEFAHLTQSAEKYSRFKAVFSSSKSLFDDFQRNIPSCHTHSDQHLVARFPLHSMLPTTFNTCNTVFICHMWKVRLALGVFLRAWSIPTSTAAFVASLFYLTSSILRYYNNPHQTFTFRLSLMRFRKRSEPKCLNFVSLYLPRHTECCLVGNLFL